LRVGWHLYSAGCCGQERPEHRVKKSRVVGKEEIVMEDKGRVAEVRQRRLGEKDEKE